MLCGRLLVKNSELAFLPAPILRALDYLKKCDWQTLENTKQEIDGENMFMVVAEYETKPPDEKKAEQHQQYIDVHYIISGKEVIGLGYAHEANVVIDSYDSTKDRISYRTIKDEAYLPLLTGMFAIFFPADIHRPGLHCDGQQKVRKAVIKIAASLAG